MGPMNAPGSVLILHTGALGDFVLAMHVVRALRAAYPSAQFSAAARSPIARWFAKRGELKATYDLESLGMHRLFAESVELPPDHVLNRHDLIISFLAGPEAAVSRNLASSTSAGVVAVDPVASTETLSTRRHITAQWLQDLQCEGLSLPTVVEAHSPQRVARPDRVVVVHPGSGAKWKCAPLEAFERIVERLRSQSIEVHWMIGPTEREWYGQSYVDRLAASAPVIEEHDLCKAAERLSRATALIGNDSGISQLASAIGLCTIVLFGPTDSAVWSPIGPDVHLCGFPESSDEFDWIAQTAVCGGDVRHHLS